MLAKKNTQDENKLVSVIIVGKEKPQLLNRCLNSLEKQIHSNIEIILVDNGSSKKMLEDVTKKYPDLKIIRNKENEFYCKPLNRGIAAAKGDFILCLNNDVLLSPVYISESIRCFSLDDKIGMVTGKMLKADKKHIDSAGLRLGKSRRPVDRGYKKKDISIFWKSGYVFGPAGSASFFRKKMLDDIAIDGEYFDEDFKIYYEDLDIAWRANNFGWKGYYTSNAIGLHYRGGSSKNKPSVFPRYDFPALNDECKMHLIKNRYLTILKNDRLCKFLLNLPFILLYDLRLWIYMMFFETKLFIDLLKKANNFKIYARKILIKRKQIKDKLSKIGGSYV